MSNVKRKQFERDVEMDYKRIDARDWKIIRQTKKEKWKENCYNFWIKNNENNEPKRERERERDEHARARGRR